ncbi:MAG TPA: transposase [Chitinophagaceae bacterium]|nr:transposase [Chitinophagaceae bacterium]
MIRTYKRKLILNDTQTKRINSWLGACRVVYNLGLEIKEAGYRAGIPVSVYDLSRQMTELRKQISWIEDVPHQCLKEALFTLDLTYKNFYKTYKKGGGFPKYAKKRKFKSIKFKEVLSVTEKTIRLSKIGSLNFFKDERILGVIKTASIVKEPTGYFVCIQCENVPPKFVSENQAIGLDMGLSHFCIDSSGNFIANPKHFKKYERQLRIENRALSRKEKGSNSWRKQCKKIALLHHKIGNVRKDFLHKETTKIAKQNSVVYLEDLNIKGMVRSNLSKHILDAGWGMFKTMLEYKTNVVKINPAYTSQTCNECGTKDSKSRISQSEFCCTSCGYISNADVNAAKNILSKGIALGRKREPLGCALALKPMNTGMSR